jgi:hypothetical protein
MENRLTALEQLLEWIDSDCTPMDCVMKAKELLKLEKQQIIDAWNDGDHAYFYSRETGRDFEDGEQYFNHIYGTDQN